MTEQTLITTPVQDVEAGEALAALGREANEAAQRYAFADYRSRKAANTLRQQDATLALFADFLRGMSVDVGDLVQDPTAWRPVTWGMVDGFAKWMLSRGYAVGTVNVRLSTIRTYAKLAMRSGALGANEYLLIQAVQGYGGSEGKRIDERRSQAGVPTRNGHKKATPVRISKEQAQALKNQPDTPQGRRDAVIVCLLSDHGLRVSEVAALTVGNVNLSAGELHFYRPKVDKWQTHGLGADTHDALRAYLEKDALDVGPLLKGSCRNGCLCRAGLSERAIAGRVRRLGKALGIEGLSPHNLRHWAATRLARSKNVKELMEIFGWKSPEMAVHYIEDAKVITVEDRGS